MKRYTTQAEIEADIKDGVLTINEDVTFECSFNINASIKVIGNINAANINAWNITAWDINAEDITAGDISYYAVALAYQSFKCKSIKGRRKNSRHFCLDKEIEFVSETADKKAKILATIEKLKAEADAL